VNIECGVFLNSPAAIPAVSASYWISDSSLNAYVNSRFGSSGIMPKAGRVIAQVVSRWPLTAEAWVHAQFSRSGTGTGFSQCPSGFPSHSTAVHSCIIWAMDKGSVRGRSSTET
jgi:hypothetical protein